MARRPPPTAAVLGSVLALAAFTASAGSDLAIDGAADVAGLTIGVGSGTNQERILLDWNEQNEARGSCRRFKAAPAIGRVLADLALGSPAGAERFRLEAHAVLR